jgi:hypothetical protein
LEDVAGDRAAGGLREQALYTLAELQRTAGNAGQAARAFEECRRRFPRRLLRQLASARLHA